MPVAVTWPPPAPADVGRAGARPRSRGRRGGCQHLADPTGARRQCTVAAEHAQAPERTALQAYASQAAGAPTPELLAAVQVDEDAVLLAFPRIDGRTFEQIGDELTDADLDKAWRAVRRCMTGDHPPHAHRRESRARRRRQGLVAQRGGGRSRPATSPPGSTSPSCCAPCHCSSDPTAQSPPVSASSDLCGWASARGPAAHRLVEHHSPGHTQTS